MARKEGQRVTLVTNSNETFRGTVLFERDDFIAITLVNSGTVRIMKKLLKAIKDG